MQIVPGLQVTDSSVTAKIIEGIRGTFKMFMHFDFVWETMRAGDVGMGFYNLDGLVPSDFHQFGLLKMLLLEDFHVIMKCDVKTAVDQWQCALY